MHRPLNDQQPHQTGHRLDKCVLTIRLCTVKIRLGSIHTDQVRQRRRYFSLMLTSGSQCELDFIGTFSLAISFSQLRLLSVKMPQTVYSTAHNALSTQTTVRSSSLTRPTVYRMQSVCVCTMSVSPQYLGCIYTERTWARNPIYYCKTVPPFNWDF